MMSVPSSSSGPKAPTGVTRARVADLSRAGLAPRQIAAALNISVQAVYQHLQRLRVLGELPEQPGRSS